MGEEYGSGDRRHEGMHCQDHVRNQERIAIFETEAKIMQENISELQTDQKAMLAMLNQINQCISRMDEKLSDFMQRYEDRVAYGDKVIEERAKEMEGIKEKIKEFDGFNWFRKPLNTVRDYFLALFFGGIVLLVAAILGGWIKIKAWIIGWLQ